MLDETKVNEKTSRRGFLKILIVIFNSLIAAMLAVPGLGYLLTPVFRKSGGSWVSLGAKNKFQANKPQKAAYSYISENGYLREQKEGFAWILQNAQTEYGYIAYSPICSHTGCNVAWEDGRNTFVCPCHNGTYDLSGDVLSGPPPRPLRRLAVKIENDQIYIQLPT
ncbi:MAG: ubiquinol-cytochrome c reductase iron-sulfur subunit [bacterium]